ncbi:hypothetical protein ACIPYS_06265 [Kitasatospora sp. NPDC089913]|uniref:hypothetical protein n=1 Tax=Kitasatospora sp. NPDC089913 TaxID=3364080 RepID=UPI00380350F1
MGKWEDVLAIFASSAQTSIADRGAIAGKDVKWTPGDGMGHPRVYHEWLKTGQDGMPNDAWWFWNFHFTYNNEVKYGSYYYGINYDYSTLGAGSPWKRFEDEPALIIEPLRKEPFANDRIDLKCFDAVVMSHQNARFFLDGWTKETKKWVDEVDAPDGDWQGSAAGAFHTVLGALYGEVASFRGQLADNGIETALQAVKPQLDKALTRLSGAITTWKADKLWHPANALNAAMADALAGATVEVKWRTSVTGTTWDESQKSTDISQADGYGDLTFKVTQSPYGDPTTKEFWEKVVARGKEIWLAHLAPLDTAAGEALLTLEQAYSALSNQMNTNHPRVEMRMPPPVQPKVETPPGTGGNGAGAKDDLDKDTKDLKQDLGAGPGGKDFKLDGGGGGAGTGSGSPGGIGGIGNIGGNGSGGGSGTGGGAKPPTSLPGDVKLPEIVPGGSGGGTTLPGGGTTLPGGGTILPGGVRVPDLLGDGAGSGGWTGGIGTGSGSRNVVLPPGSRITDEGRVVDSEGRPVLDTRGNPMVVGRDYTVGPDGTLLDGRGVPVPESRQIIDDLGRSYLDEDDLLAPNDFGLGLSGLGGAGVFGGSGAGGGSAVLGPGGISPITGVGSGLGSRAIANGADPSVLKAASDAANERLAAERAARAAAAEQSALTGRQVTTTGGSGMPPMMPPGAGAGAGAGGNEKDRQRTTWLAEDEEVWGTDSGAVEGVIGR